MNPAPRLRLAALVAAAAMVAVACSGGSTAAPILPSGVPTEAPATEAPSTGAPATEVPATGGYPADCPTEPPAALGADEKATVTLATEQGDIVIAIDGALAPNATGNFLALAECGAYDGVIFHRLVPGFVIQGGDVQYGRKPNVDPSLVGRGGPPYRITDDPVTTPYGRATVAMARTSEPNSQGSQFFIVLDEAAKAPLESFNTYAIIGTVTDGMDVVDAIAAMPNSGSDTGNQALEPVAITGATVTRP
jgi:cyclophilin family peptidyl-prolyl cis-trans isomerase